MNKVFEEGIKVTQKKNQKQCFKSYYFCTTFLTNVTFIQTNNYFLKIFYKNNNNCANE